MTSAVTDQLVLPEPFTIEAAGASIARTGRRSIGWTFHDVGKIEGNGYAWGHVQVTEDHAFRSEPLRPSGQRRLTPNGDRTQWTDRALSRLQTTLVLPIQRYGFTRLWEDLHQQAHAPRVRGAEEQQQRALQLARWWEAKAELDALYAQGLLEVRTLTDRDARVVDCPAVWTRYERTNTVATLRMGDEVLGWLTDQGDTCPASPRFHPF